jgi:nicotinate-nucleotide pyrophosphorylase (carboxylating)
MVYSPPKLDAFVSPQQLTALLQAAREEDLGAAGVDITSECCVPAEITRTAVICAREHGVVAGLALLTALRDVYDTTLTVTPLISDGKEVEAGVELAEVEGSLRSMLAMERVALNLLSHLSGVATLTNHFVEAIRHTPARIFDTRKTLPGLRGLQKYAVACGGGATHRMGLYDAVLIKDNHLAHIPTNELSAQLDSAVQTARTQEPPPAFVEVEVDTFAQLEIVLGLDVDIVLLDNMTPHQLSQAVAMRDQHAPAVQLEASGGVNLDSVTAIADSGIERISVGALTHSPPSVDIAMDLQS